MSKFDKIQTRSLAALAVLLILLYSIPNQGAKTVVGALIAVIVISNVILILLWFAYHLRRP